MTAKESTPEFRAIVEHKLCAYRSQVATWRPKRCRLVQYTGADRPNCRDVDIGQIEDDIAFNLEEGLYVDWHRTEEDVYLCTQEPGCPIPPWGKIFAEEPMIDVDKLLRRAGHDA